MYVAVFKRFEFGFAEHTKIFEKNPGVFSKTKLIHKLDHSACCNAYHAHVLQHTQLVIA